MKLLLVSLKLPLIPVSLSHVSDQCVLHSCCCAVCLVVLHVWLCCFSIPQYWGPQIFKKACHNGTQKELANNARPLFLSFVLFPYPHMFDPFIVFLSRQDNAPSDSYRLSISEMFSAACLCANGPVSVV